MSTAELETVRTRLRETALTHLAIDDVAYALAHSIRRRLRYLASFSSARDIDSLLADPKAVRAYGLMRRDHQLDLSEALGRWIDREIDEAARRADRAPAAPAEPDLVAWAIEHGIEAYLDKPLAELAPFTELSGYWYGDLSRQVGGATVRSAAAGRARAAGLSPQSLTKAARAYLERVVVELAERAEREKRWSPAPSEPVLERLTYPLRELEARTAEEATFASPVEPFTFDESLLEARAVARGVLGAVTLSFAAHEDGLLSSHAVRPAYLLSLVRDVLDAVYRPEHPLHAALAESLARPAWSRLLHAVDGVIAAAPAPEGRLAFVLEAVEDGTVQVEPIWQTRTARGWNRGRRYSPSRVDAIVDPRERLAMLALATRFDMTRESDAVALSALVGHPTVLDDKTRAPLTVRRVEASFAFCEDGLVLRPGVALGALRLHSAALERISRSKIVARIDSVHGEVLVATIGEELRALLAVVARIPAKATHDDAASILPMIEKAAAHMPVTLPPSIEETVQLAPLALVVRLHPEDEGARVEIRARVSPHLSHHAGEGGALVSVLAAGTGTAVLRRRDLAAERHQAHLLAAKLGLPDGELTVSLADEEAVLVLLDAARAIPDLEVEWPDDDAGTKVVGSVSSLKIRVKSAAEWFGVEGEAEVDGERVKLAQLLAAIRAGKRFVKIGARRFAVIEAALRERLERAADVVFESQKGALSIVPAGGDAIESLGDEEMRADAAWTRIRARLNDAAPIDAPVPPALVGTLRDYQRAGFAWLARLAALESGAILADDMGLGKTIQALALLVHRAAEGPALVVTPTSVSDNWVREAQRFAPSLRLRLHRGAGRHTALAKTPLGPHDVLVASYDVVALDQEKLAPIALATLVLDEAQWIKNPEAQRSVAVRRLTARVRIALTGTPLENRLSELWSIVATVHPGLLGPWTHFRGRFAIPIERDGNQERLRALSSLVRPYLLRRTKEVVAPELPPRIEIVREVELSEAERRLYDAEREAAIAALENADESNRFQVLASITRLRELACDSELVVPGAGLPSSKLTALVEIVEELESSGRRVLVFSQFVRLLERAAALLTARGITHLMLDGSTPASERQVRVDRFMRGEATVFLLSLKAGGIGLNLTAADHVVHLDPWWNPAVEDQASDRAHRIGQDKPVTIVRLVAKDTIEAHVLSLHDEKRALSRGVLEGADAAGTLSATELVSLIRGNAIEAIAPKRAGRRR